VVQLTYTKLLIQLIVHAFVQTVAKELSKQQLSMDFKVVKYTDINLRPHILKIFEEFKDIFPKNEIEQIKIDLSTPSQINHLKNVLLNTNNTPIGYIGAIIKNTKDNKTEHKSANCDWFVINKNYHRKGAGQYLFSCLTSALKSFKVDVLLIETCSCKNETPARKFYMKQGAELVSIDENFYAMNHSRITYKIYL
jgi:hypothetical protein